MPPRSCRSAVALSLALLKVLLAVVAVAPAHNREVLSVTPERRP
jgi:hypothetical protein